MPAQAGIQFLLQNVKRWVPAFAGRAEGNLMTEFYAATGVTLTATPSR
jgi:hypothetical protein